MLADFGSFASPAKGVGLEFCWRMPKLLVKLSACCKGKRRHVSLVHLFLPSLGYLVDNVLELSQPVRHCDDAGVKEVNRRLCGITTFKRISS